MGEADLWGGFCLPSSAAPRALFHDTCLSPPIASNSHGLLGVNSTASLWSLSLASAHLKTTLSLVLSTPTFPSLLPLPYCPTPLPGTKATRPLWFKRLTWYKSIPTNFLLGVTSLENSTLIAVQTPNTHHHPSCACPWQRPAFSPRLGSRLS